MPRTRRRPARRPDLTRISSSNTVAVLDIRVGVPRRPPDQHEPHEETPPPDTAPTAQEEQAALEALQRHNLDRLKDVAAVPPFHGPISALSTDDYWRCYWASEQSPYCREYFRNHDGFFRIDHLPDGAVWRTDVQRSGAVHSVLLGHEPVVDLTSSPRYGVTLPVATSATDNPWRFYAEVVSRYEAMGTDFGGDPPIVECPHPFASGPPPVCDWIYRYQLDPEDGCLRRWSFAGKVPIGYQCWTPTPENGFVAVKTRRDYQNQYCLVDSRMLWRVANRIADLIVQRQQERQRDADQPMAEALRILAKKITAIQGPLQRYLTAKNCHIRGYKREWEEELTNAVMRLRLDVLCAGTAISNRSNNKETARPEITSRSLYEQLTALTQEFSTVEINHYTGTLSIVTPPVVLQDPQLPVTAELGRFRIAYPMEDLADRVPSTESFKAIALEPRYPVIRSGIVQTSGHIPHPHVSDEGICFGAAMMPLARALLDGRLYDAFMIAYAVIMEYSAGASPYSRPWRWHYTSEVGEQMIAQARMAAAGSPAVTLDDDPESDEDEDDEEDEDDVEEEDEEERCARCDNPTTDCSCLTCDNCNDRYDSENSGGACKQCECSFCDRCLHACDCDECTSGGHCFGCLEGCDNCSHSTVCPECLESCHGNRCSKMICHDCRNRCSECGDDFCDDCYTSCEHCEAFMCTGCLDSHGETCRCCQEKKCDALIDKCPACGEEVCADCLVQPAWSLHEVCPDCVTACAGCHREFSTHEIVLNGLCPTCYVSERKQSNEQQREAQLRHDLRARPGEALLLDLFAGPGEQRRRAPVAHAVRANGSPGAVRDEAQLRADGRQGRDGDTDLPADRRDGEAADRDEVAGAVGERAGRSAPAPADPAETGRVCNDYDEQGHPYDRPRWVYPGLPLFNIAVIEAGDAT